MQRVERAKEINAGLFLSLDPGMLWASKATDTAIGRLLAASDLLFLNSEEGRALEAAGVLEQISATVFRKSPDCIVIERRAARDGALYRREVPVARLPASEIRNPTGTGDVFAAGVLAVLHDHPEDMEAAASSGVAAARNKLLGLDFCD